MININKNLPGNSRVRVWWEIPRDSCFQPEQAQLSCRLGPLLSLDFRGVTSHSACDKKTHFPLMLLNRLA